MAALAEAGTRLYDCPTCHYLTPYPVAIDQPPVCVQCLQGEWPDDPRIKLDISEQEVMRGILLIASLGLIALGVSALLSKLGYL